MPAQRYLVVVYLLILAGSLLLIGCGSAASSPTSEPLDPQAAAGQRLFKQNCTSCHSTTPDEVVVGPSLFGVGQRAGGRVEGLAARDYIRTSILTPDAYIVDGFADLMPKQFGKKFSEEDIDSLIAFLMSLQ